MKLPFLDGKRKENFIAMEVMMSDLNIDEIRNTAYGRDCEKAYDKLMEHRNRLLDEIDRLENCLSDFRRKEYHTKTEVEIYGEQIEKRTKEACIQPVWVWICEVINTKGKTFQKDELKQAIKSAEVTDE